MVIFAQHFAPKIIRQRADGEGAENASANTNSGYDSICFELNYAFLNPSGQTPLVFTRPRHSNTPKKQRKTKKYKFNNQKKENGSQISKKNNNATPDKVSRRASKHSPNSMRHMTSPKISRVGTKSEGGILNTPKLSRAESKSEGANLKKGNLIPETSAQKFEIRHKKFPPG